MLYGEQSREDLEEYAEKLFAKSEVVRDKNSRRKLYDELIDKFGIDVSIADDMITFKKDIKEFTSFQIFCVLWFLDRKSLSKFFTESEINALSKEKIVKEKVTFPLVIDNMVQISEDQWIGKTTLQMLMKWRDAQLLNYDENEQRALRRVKFGNIEVFKPYVNGKSVTEIRASMENGSYIPDTITLNMPDGSEYEYENGKLTIFSLPNGMFNLDDGYHRYLAMSQIHDFNKEFDFPMELRIVNFENTKATSFIFQQDQKTKMKKINSDTYDINSIPNRVVTRINNDRLGCNITGMIGRNNAKIDMGVLSRCISYFYIKEKPNKEEEMKYIIALQNELTSKFNAITSQDQIFLGKYSDAMILATIYVFASDIPVEKYAESIHSIVDNLTEDEEKFFRVSASGTIRKKAINIIEEKLGRG